jgi:flagellar basal body-associated protein FliL
MPEPAPRDEILTGRDENAPWRAQNRVLLVIIVVVLLVGGLIYGLYAAFHGKEGGRTMPVPVPAVISA